MTSWEQLTGLIQAAAGTTVQLDYIRDGQQVTKSIPIVQTQRPVLDDQGKQIGIKDAGFLGISVTNPYTQQSFGAAVTQTGAFIGAAAKAVVAIPARIPALWDAVFNGAPRGLDSPVGIVGAGRIGGEILDSDNTSSTDKLVLFLNLLAGLQHEPVPAEHAAAAAVGRRAHSRRDDRVGAQGLGDRCAARRTQVRSTWQS